METGRMGNVDESQESVSERERLAVLMSEVGIALTRGGSLRSVLGDCVEAMVPNLEAAFARIWVLNERTQELELEASAGMYTHLDGDHSRVPMGKFKIGKIAQERKPHLTNSVVGDSRVGNQDWARREGMVAFAGYPLLVEDRLFGVIAIFARKPLSAAVLRAMATISRGISVAIRQRFSEDALRISESRSSAIVNNALACIITFELDGKVIEFNPAAEITFGYTREEALDLKAPNVFFAAGSHEGCRAILDQPISQSLTEKNRSGIELIAARADGSEFPAEVSMVRIPVGHSQIVAMYIRDIGERKEADRKNERLLAAAQAAEQNYRDLAEAMPQQVWTARPSGELDYVNQRVSDYCSTPAAELLNAGWTKIVHPDDLPECIVSWSNSIRTGEPYEIQFRLRRTADGAYRWHLGRAVCVRDGSGNITRWLGTNTDIHDRKSAEADLAAAHAAADSANQAKSQFLANTSHELRTPLNAVIGYSEMLLEEAADHGLEQLVPDLQRIHRAGRYLLTLINNVLDLSKIEAGRMDLVAETFDIYQTIDDISETAKPLMERNRNRLEVDCKRDIGSMHSDLTKIRQCLFNLLSNSAKFTTDGLIQLHVSVAQAGWIRFRVTDSGMGITPEDLARLFEPFAQARSAAVTPEQGTGLGLAITRQFSRLMGGDVTVQSEPGKGSSFTIDLPRLAAELVEAEKPVPVPPAPVAIQRKGSNRLLALLVDDDAAARELMLRYLQKEGFDAVTAGDGREALRLARELRPSFITLDVMMPGMDGWAVLSALKADPDLSGIPVIMVSIVDDHKMGYALGATEYLTKPVERKQLLTLVGKYGRHSSERNVLVVEDDEASRSLLKRILEEDGWHVVQAENGEIALRSVAEQIPDLILLDIFMPQMDGFDFAFAVRKNEKWRHIPIVVITAMDLSSEDRARLNGKVNAILTKGAYTREELLEEIRDLAWQSAQT
jgi:PAS domain S-box-containing protein